MVRRRPRRDSGASSRALLCAVPATLVALAAGWSRRWVAEDGFIYLRIARNIASGNGPVFNPGERVEAATGTIWVWALAVLHQVSSVRLEWLAVALGLCCTAGALVVTQVASASWWRRGMASTWWLPAGAAVVALWPPAWDFTTSGLEGSLALLWVAATWWVLVHGGSTWRPRARLEVVLLTSSWLVRPDLALMGAVALVGWWRSRPDRRSQRVADLVLGSLPVAAVQLARMAYFAALAPTPALAKEGTRVRIDRGLSYLWDAGRPYGTWVFVAVTVAALVWLTLRRAAGPGFPAWTITTAGLVHLAYVAAVGGDFMHGRMAIPGVFAVVATWAAVLPLRRVAVGVSAVVVLAAAVVAVVGRPPPNNPIITDERAYWVGLSRNEHPVVVEDYLDVEWPQTEVAQRAAASLALGERGLWILDRGRPVFLPGPLDVDQPVAVESYNIGIPGFSVPGEVYVADQLGLANPVVARLEPTPGPKIGHEKNGGAWTTATLDPDAAALAEVRRTPPEVVVGAVDAVRCSWLGELRRTISDDLTATTALRGVLRAIPWWFRRIPTDPLAAERELCDGEPVPDGAPPG